MQTLGQILNPVDLQRLQKHFAFNVASVRCEWGPTDGKFNRMASARSAGLFSSDGHIIFDPEDFPYQWPDLGDPLVLETILHELKHLEQYKRGFIFRFKMKYWNSTLAYLERPHEKEAHEWANAVAKGKQ